MWINNEEFHQWEIITEVPTLNHPKMRGHTASNFALSCQLHDLVVQQHSANAPTMIRLLSITGFSFKVAGKT